MRVSIPTSFLTVSSLFLSIPTTIAGNKWEFYAFSGLPGMLSYGRLDPIVSPGVVSSHVHQFHGGNAVSATYNYDTIRKESTCSTLIVQDDLSNYWTPAMYHYDGASNYTLMHGRFSVYYQFATLSYNAKNAGGSTQRYPFPPGLTMLAGNMYQRAIDGSDPFSTAPMFQCQRSNGDSPYSHDMRDFQKDGVNCDNDLRATVDFPSCWDGVANNSDRTHVVYPANNAICPASHPYSFMKLVLEYYWPVGSFPFDASRANNWVLSFGDTSGFGMHADFTNGWNITLLTEAINTCNTTEAGIEHCPAFSKWNNTQVPPCMPSGLYPNELVGADSQALTALPGCNPLWIDNSTKPTCTPTIPNPPINLRWGPDLSQWNYISCPFFWQKDGWLLNAHLHTSWTNMTTDSCLAECQSLNYTYAMMTWSDNCYCDNQIRNNGTTASDPNYACQVRCNGDYAQFCGGFGSGLLFERCTGQACHQNNAFPVQTTAAPVWVTTTSASTSSSVKPISPSTSMTTLPTSSKGTGTTKSTTFKSS